MSIYISGINSISPVEIFSKEMAVPEKQILQDEYSYLTCKEPVYKEIINPMLLRRMSRVIKMGLASALLCLKDAGKDVPDAIITATGLGCVEDSDKFLTSLIENEEKMLNPTPFIQSTHNTIGSQIALQLKCHGYNSTYAGRGASFEMALMDSLMLLSEKEVKNILVGAYDELTPNLITIFYRLGMFRKNNSNHIPGEGSMFMLLSAEKGPNDYACLKDVAIFNEESSYQEQISTLLKRNNLQTTDLDTVFLGTTQAHHLENEYKNIFTLLSETSTIAGFKHLSGDYFTTSSFATWLAANCMKNQIIPDVAVVRKGISTDIKNLLIINHTIGNQYSAILLAKC